MQCLTNKVKYEIAFIFFFSRKTIWFKHINREAIEQKEVLFQEDRKKADHKDIQVESLSCSKHFTEIQAQNAQTQQGIQMQKTFQRPSL